MNKDKTIVHPCVSCLSCVITEFGDRKCQIMSSGGTVCGAFYSYICAIVSEKYKRRK